MTEKKNNLRLATRIINERGSVQKHEVFGTYYADLQTTLGMSLGSVKKKKEDAIKDMALQLAGTLDSGELILSDTWEEDNLGAEE